MPGADAAADDVPQASPRDASPSGAADMTREEMQAKIDQLRAQRNQAYAYIDKLRAQQGGGGGSGDQSVIEDLRAQNAKLKKQLQKQHDSATAKIVTLNDKILTLRASSETAEADRRAVGEAEAVIETLRQAVKARVDERDQALSKSGLQPGSPSASHSSSPLHSNPQLVAGGGAGRQELLDRVADLEEKVESLRSQRDIARAWIAARQQEDKKG